MKTATVYLTALSVSVAVHALALGAILGSPAQAQVEQVPLPKTRPTMSPRSDEMRPVSPPSGMIGADSLLPPRKFDHPYAGYLVIDRYPTLEQANDRCIWWGSSEGAFACSKTIGGTCLVVIPTDTAILMAGFDLDAVWRHEIGHCNGWKGHTGNRYNWAPPLVPFLPPRS